MTNQELFALMDKFIAGGLTGLKLTGKDFSLELARGALAPAFSPAQAACAAPPEPEGEVLTAPLVGTYYASSAPDDAPFVSAGERAVKGQTVCLIEAMKMMNEVKAPRDCVVEELLCKDGDLVGFEAPLLRYRPL